MRELVGVKTGRNNKSCKLKQIQVISVRSAGVPFKVIQSLGTSRYGGSAQQLSSQVLGIGFLGRTGTSLLPFWC